MHFLPWLSMLWQWPSKGRRVAVKWRQRPCPPLQVYAFAETKRGFAVSQ